MKGFGTAVLTVGVVLMLLPGCTEMMDRLSIRSGMQSLGLDLSAGTVVEDGDSHGGFHGDGRTFTVVTIAPEDREAVEEDMTGAYWHALPITENVARAARSLAVGDDGESLFPEIGQGYYYFRDRHSESRDRGDDSELFSRASWNFTMAVYDSESGALYYFEFDT